MMMMSHFYPVPDELQCLRHWRALLQTCHFTELTRSSTQHLQSTGHPTLEQTASPRDVEADTVNTFKNRLDKEWGN